MRIISNNIINNQRSSLTVLPTCTYFTKHAKDRMQQRGISRSMIDFLIDFGAIETDGNHGEKYYFDKRSKKRLRTYLGREHFYKIEAKLSIYAVVVDGMIITCGHLYKKVRKH